MTGFHWATSAAQDATLHRLRVRGALGSTVAALAQYRGVSRQSMQQLLWRLERRGLVTRTTASCAHRWYARESSQEVA